MSSDTVGTKASQRSALGGTKSSTSSISLCDPPKARRSRGSYRRQLAGSGPGSPTLGAEAKRTAAIILEVLAGLRTPAGAASALGIAVPRYYVWEQRAVQGLVAACESRPKGRVASPDRRLAELERELAITRRELTRHQALARTAQRALGLPAAAEVRPTSTTRDKTRSKSQEAAGTVWPKRRHRPTARALRAARLLCAPDSSGADSPNAVQSSHGPPVTGPPPADQSSAE
jgi:hypothetical protein